MTLHSSVVEDVDHTFLPLSRFLCFPLFPFKFELKQICGEPTMGETQNGDLKD